MHVAISSKTTCPRRATEPWVCIDGLERRQPGNEPQRSPPQVICPLDLPPIGTNPLGAWRHACDRPHSITPDDKTHGSIDEKRYEVTRRRVGAGRCTRAFKNRSQLAELGQNRAFIVTRNTMANSIAGSVLSRATEAEWRETTCRVGVLDVYVGNVADDVTGDGVDATVVVVVVVVVVIVASRSGCRRRIAYRSNCCSDVRTEWVSFASLFVFPVSEGRAWQSVVSS